MMKYATLDESSRARLAELKRIYAEIDAAQVVFSEAAKAKSNPVSCPTGCGRCCSTFKPYILQVEADFAAFYLLEADPGAAERFERAEAKADSPACPFQDPSRTDGTCTIYPARPLICRLFGFSATKNKRGEPEFSLCKHMPSLASGAARRFSGAAALVDVFGAAPPLMADFGVAAMAVDPHSGGETEMIGDAVRSALDRIALVQRWKPM